MLDSLAACQINYMHLSLFAFNYILLNYLVLDQNTENSMRSRTLIVHHRSRDPSCLLALQQHIQRIAVGVYPYLAQALHKHSFLRILSNLVDSLV